MIFTKRSGAVDRQLGITPPTASPLYSLRIVFFRYTHGGSYIYDNIITNLSANNKGGAKDREVLPREIRVVFYP